MPGAKIHFSPDQIYYENIPEGDYRIEMWIDALNSVGESQEANNFPSLDSEKPLTVEKDWRRYP